MPQAILRYHKGINQDIDKNTLTDGNYFTLENGRVISDKQLSQGSVTTIRGNVKIIDIPDGHRIKAQWQFATSSSVPTLSITALGVTTVFTSSALTPELKADDLVNQINTSDKPYKAFFIEATSVFYITPLVHTTTISITSSGVSEFALDSSNYFNINGTKTLGDYLTIVDGWTTQVPMVRGYGIQGDRLILFCQVTIGDVDNLAIYSIKFGGISIDVKLAYFCSNWKFGTIMNESIVHYESDNVFTIYWLNVIDEAPSPIYTLNLNADDSYFTPKSMLNIVPDVRLCEPMLTDIQLGGKLKVGKIQYSYCLYKKYGQESNYSPFSGLFHLTDKSDKGDYQNYCGAPRYEDGTTTSRSANKTVFFNIPDVDQNYTHIKVVSIWYDTLNGAPICNIIADQKISGTSMSFVDTGDSLGDISIETILTKKTRIRCKTITEKNNILFAGNVEEESTYIQALEDYDTRAYRFGSASARGISLQYNQIAVLCTNLKPSDTAGDYIPRSGTPGTYTGTEYVAGVWNQAATSAYWDSDVSGGGYVIDAAGNPNWKTVVGSRGNISANSVLKEHNCVNRFNDVSTPSSESMEVPDIYDFMYQSDGTTLGGEGINIKYELSQRVISDVDTQYIDGRGSGGAVYLSKIKNSTADSAGISYGTFASPHMSAYELSLEYDEIYAIGISWKLNDGTDYPVQWIADIRTTRWLDIDLAYSAEQRTIDLYSCVCMFYIAIPSTIQEYIQGFTIVSCKRDSDNRTVRSIGLLNQLHCNRFEGLSFKNTERGNYLSKIPYKLIDNRYYDGIRHKKFSSSGGASEIMLNSGGSMVDDYFGDDVDNLGQRRSNYYEYISPELAFNSDYKIANGDKLVPIQMFYFGSYVGTSTFDIGNNPYNACGAGPGVQLSDDSTIIGTRKEVKSLFSSQKITTSLKLSHISTSRPLNDMDYRKGFQIEDFGIIDPGDIAYFNGGNTYKHSWIDRQYVSTNKDSEPWNIIAEAKNVSSAIIAIDNDSNEILIGDSYYSKKTSEPNGRECYGIYVMHRRMFYPFGGHTYAGRRNREYHKSSKYIGVINTGSQQIKTTELYGDSFVVQYQHVRHVKNELFLKTDPNEIVGECYEDVLMHTHVVTFPVITSINTELRHDTDIPRYSLASNINTNAGLQQQQEWKRLGDYPIDYKYPESLQGMYLAPYAQKRDLNLYNTVYSLVRGWDVYLPLPYNTSDTTKFPTRMLASNNKINDELIDSWTQVSVFKDKDLEVKYGEIVDLIVWKDRLFAIQEAGIATVAVNERSAVSDASGETLSIAGTNVFSYHQYSSTYTGTKFKYKFSIVSAPEVLYLYDSNRSVMAYLSQSDENASLSDVKGLYSWFDLNLQPENITYIQSVYDTNYNEILTSIECGSTVTTIVFSEKMLTYEMFLKHVRGVINIGTPARLLSWQMNAMAKSVVWQHNIGKENMLWGTYYPLNLSAVFTSRGKMERYHGLINSIMLLDNVEFIADVSNMNGYTIEAKYIDNESITSIRAYNGYQDTGVMSLVDSNKKLISRLIMRFARKWRMNKFWDILRPNKYRPDVTIRDSYVQVDMQFNGKLYDETAITNRSLQLSDVTVNYRELNQTQY